MGNNPIFPNGISALHFVGLCVPPWLARHSSKVQRVLIFNFQGAGVGSDEEPTLVTSGRGQKVPLCEKNILLPVASNLLPSLVTTGKSQKVPTVYKKTIRTQWARSSYL